MPDRPELYGVLSIAAQHQRQVETWWRRKGPLQERLKRKHAAKVQKLLRRAERLATK